MDATTTNTTSAPVGTTEGGTLRSLDQRTCVQGAISLLSLLMLIVMFFLEIYYSL
jgi:hypothetical protein